MSVLDDLRGKASENPKRIVLPEAEDERTLRAAARLHADGIAVPVLVGARAPVEAAAARFGVDLSGIAIEDPALSPLRPAALAAVREAVSGTRYAPGEAEAWLADPVYFAAALVRAGEADGSVSGAAHTTADTLRAALRVIRPALREFDAFHVVLYQLYHYDLPSDDLAAMRKTIERMKEPMAALDAAKVPPRLAKKEKEFVSARADLSKAVAALEKAAQTDDLARVKAAVEEVHDRYEMATAVCD